MDSTRPIIVMARLKKHGSIKIMLELNKFRSKFCGLNTNNLAIRH